MAPIQVLLTTCLPFADSCDADLQDKDRDFLSPQWQEHGMLLLPEERFDAFRLHVKLDRAAPELQAMISRISSC